MGILEDMFKGELEQVLAGISQSKMGPIAIQIAGGALAGTATAKILDGTIEFEGDPDWATRDPAHRRTIARVLGRAVAMKIKTDFRDDGTNFTFRFQRSELIPLIQKEDSSLKFKGDGTEFVLKLNKQLVNAWGQWASGQAPRPRMKGKK
jgi:hypothetical protein